MKSDSISLSLGLTVAAASAFLGGMIIHLGIYSGDDGHPLRFFGVSGTMALCVLLPAAIALIISMIEKRPATVLTGRASGWFVLFVIGISFMISMPFEVYGLLYFAPTTLFFAFLIGLPTLLIAAAIVNRSRARSIRRAHQTSSLI